MESSKLVDNRKICTSSIRNNVKWRYRKSSDELLLFISLMVSRGTAFHTRRLWVRYARTFCIPFFLLLSVFVAKLTGRQSINLYMFVFNIQWPVFWTGFEDPIGFFKVGRPASTEKQLNADSKKPKVAVRAIGDSNRLRSQSNRQIRSQRPARDNFTLNLLVGIELRFRFVVKILWSSRNFFIPILFSNPKKLCTKVHRISGFKF